MTLSNYVDSTENFQNLSNTEQLKYMAYFYSKVNNINTFKPIQLEKCFDDEHLLIPKNIPQLISNNTKGRTPLFVKKSDGFYVLNREVVKSIDAEFGMHKKTLIPSSNLFPIELLDNTRGYITKVGGQAIICYDYEQYDASLVMIRKLLETLIIEIFENFKISEEIKDSDGNFYMLGQLIDGFLANKNWNISRTVKKYFPEIKKLADTSAHNRRFIAKKPDIDKYKSELRMIIEELVHIANF